MNAERFLLDVNILVALFDPAHTHHRIVARWFSSPASTGGSVGIQDRWRGGKAGRRPAVARARADRQFVHIGGRATSARSVKKRFPQGSKAMPPTAVAFWRSRLVPGIPRKDCRCRQGRPPSTPRSLLHRRMASFPKRDRPAHPARGSRSGNNNCCRKTSDWANSRTPCPAMSWLQNWRKQSLYRCPIPHKLRSRGKGRRHWG